MKRILFIAVAMVLSLGANAQGRNTGMGGSDGDYQSLSERVFKLEKKTDAFNVYFNYAAAFQELFTEDDNFSKFTNKQARIEIKGNLTDKISYRWRHRLNKNNTAMGTDNFAKATDILMVGYQFNDKWSIQGGKMCQNHGGFEFDENPMYIYQYSDMVDYMDNFMAGVNLSFKPVPNHEFDINITNSYNDGFGPFYGSNSFYGKQLEYYSASKHPLTYIFLWAGNMFDGMLQTRWSYSLQNQAEDANDHKICLGQQLVLPKFQWYIDYMGEWDDIDRLGIASADGAGFLATRNASYFSGVTYHSLITKANWQFAPQWNLMLKGCYETASVADVAEFDGYRKSLLWMANLEYYPDPSQDFRVFLSYVGRNFSFTDDAKYAAGLDDYSTNRIELGFMFRIKAF
ncbi:MAG: porin [Muribaculaceae bacterium]|nr:porin [Muribaculaceae bacterium]